MTWGSTVQKSLEAAEQLADEDKSVEVIDLRSLDPLGKEAVASSLRRTSRLLVVTRTCLTSGFGAEVAACVGRGLFRRPRCSGLASWRDRHVRRLRAHSRAGDPAPDGRRRCRGEGAYHLLILRRPPDAPREKEG